jgi:FG-GAP-like repeat
VHAIVRFRDFWYIMFATASKTGKETFVRSGLFPKGFLIATLGVVVLLSLRTTAQPPAVSSPLRSFDRFIPLEGSGDHSAAISLGDVNGDGNLDIVLSTGRHWASPIRLYLNDGKGNFPGFTNVGDDRGYKSYGVPLADLNGDGFLDIAAGTDSPDDKPVFLNDGRGHFTLAGTVGDPKMPTRNIAVADLNGDGYPDIVLANRGVQSYVYLNDGKGGFGQRKAFGGADDSSVTVVVADVDGDGKPDLIVAKRDGQQSVVYINDGKANFGDGRPFGPEHGDTRAVAAGDLNGDGFVDVVACDLLSGAYIYWNDGHGHFSRATNSRLRRISSSPWPSRI